MADTLKHVALDALHRELGAPEGRERKKIVEWEDMVVHARHQSHD